MNKRKIIALLLSLSLALGLTACGEQGNSVNTQEGGESTEDNAQIPNPFQDFETYAEAEEAAGYAFAAPESVGGYPEVSYSVMNDGELFQIVYRSDADEITARKAPGSDDISGDYNEYAESNLSEDVDTLPVTVKGNDGKAFLALWTDDENGYSYSLTVREGMEQEAFLSLVQAIQDGEAALNDDTIDNPMEGGWSLNNGVLSLDGNSNVKAAFEKATEGLAGDVYEPIAYLGSREDVGMNYRILCRGTAVAPDAPPAYEILTVGENADDDAEITETIALPGVPAELEELEGGWTVNAADFTPEAYPDVLDAFEKATGDLIGVGYEPIAYLACQEVAGMNYKLFCRTTPVIPETSSFFTVVTVYADLEGNAEIADVTNVNFAEF